MNNAMIASLLCLNRRIISWVWEISPTLLSAATAAGCGRGALVQTRHR